VSRRKFFTLVLALLFAVQIGVDAHVSAISQEDYSSLGWSSKYYWKSQQGVCGSASTNAATPAPTTTDTTGQSGSAAPTNLDYGGNQILNTS